MSSVRVLVPGDEPALAAFFARHPDTTLFFQSNLSRGGLVDTGAVYEATWAASFEDGAIVALANHCWNGNVLLAASCHLAAVVRATLHPGRDISGILGTRGQVNEARETLGLAAAAAFMDSTEDLFALELARLRVPGALASRAWTCRAPRDEELEMLMGWRHDYRVATIGETPGVALFAKCREEIERYQREDIHFVLEVDGASVGYSAFNASTQDCVQIGGVWTPPPLRSRGYARAVVAGSLLAARARGVTRSVLFTETDNHAAQAAYRAIGFERVGDYGMVLFEQPAQID